MLPKKVMGAPYSMSEEAGLADQLLFICSDIRVVFSLSLRKIKVIYLLEEKKNTWEETGKAWKQMFMKLNAGHMNDDSLVSTLIRQRNARLLKTKRISTEF